VKDVDDPRICVEPVPVRKGHYVSISYKGLLVNSGADNVWLHYGFDGWRNVHTTAMAWQPDGSCRANILVQGDREVNFCFKDSANNWDNNSGMNWKIDIL
jgi:hypothetical protein